MDAKKWPKFQMEQRSSFLKEVLASIEPIEIAFFALQFHCFALICFVLL